MTGKNLMPNQSLLLIDLSSLEIRVSASQYRTPIPIGEIREIHTHRSKNKSVKTIWREMPFAYNVK